MNYSGEHDIDPGSLFIDKIPENQTLVRNSFSNNAISEGYVEVANATNNSFTLNVLKTINSVKYVNYETEPIDDFDTKDWNNEIFFKGTINGGNSEFNDFGVWSESGFGGSSGGGGERNPPSLLLEKVWKAVNIPDEIEVTMLQNDSPYRSVFLKKLNNWKQIVYNFPLRDDTGNLYVYSFQEKEGQGNFKSSVEPVKNTDGLLEKVTITNTEYLATKDIQVKKEWDHGTNREENRPTSITVELRGGTETRTVILSAENGWQAAFENLPIYENGQVINYYVMEQKVKNYISVVTEQTISLKNEFNKVQESEPPVVEPEPQPQPEPPVVEPEPQPQPEPPVVEPEPQPQPEPPVVEPEPSPTCPNLTEEQWSSRSAISVEKNWTSSENAPQTIWVDLYANGQYVNTFELSQNGGLIGEFPNYQDCQLIVYTVQEKPVENYTLTEMTTTFTIKNTYVAPPACEEIVFEVLTGETTVVVDGETYEVVDGKVSVKDLLPPGKYEVTNSEGEELGELVVSEECEGTYTPVPPTTCPNFKLTVKDDAGNSVSGKTVTITSIADETITYSVTTDENGVATVEEVLEEGTYEVYDGTTSLGTIEVTEPTCEGEVKLPAPPTPEPPACEEFKLTVIGENVAGKEVVLTLIENEEIKGTAIIGEDGIATFSPMPLVGEYKVTVDGNDLPDTVILTVGDCEESVTVPTPEPPACEEFKLTVIGENVAGKEVVLTLIENEEIKGTATIGEDGVATFSPMPLVGEYKVTVDGNDLPDTVILIEGDCEESVTVPTPEPPACEEFVTITVPSGETTVVVDGKTYEVEDGKVEVPLKDLAKNETYDVTNGEGEKLGKITTGEECEGTYKPVEQPTPEPPEKICPKFELTIKDTSGNPVGNTTVTLQSTSDTVTINIGSNGVGETTKPIKEGTYEVMKDDVMIGTVEVLEGECKATVIVPAPPVPSTPSCPKFTLTLKDTSGNPIGNTVATLTSGTKTETISIGSNGVGELTTPLEEGMYTVTFNGKNVGTIEVKENDCNAQITLGKVNIFVEKLWVQPTNEGSTEDTAEVTVLPTSVTVDLYANGILIDNLTLSEQSNWQGTFSNLDELGVNGNPIAYTVKERAVENYKAAYERNGNKITITNTYEEGSPPAPNPSLINIPVNKVWANGSGNIPDSVNLYLRANDVIVGAVTVTAAGNWQGTFTNVAEFDIDGNKVAYTVVEQPIANYTPTYSGNVSGFTVKNTYNAPAPVTINIPVTKVWERVTGSSATVELYANGVATGKSLTLTANQDWKGTFEGLMKYDSAGVPIVYTVKEQAMSRYVTTIVGDMTSGFVVTNRYVSSSGGGGGGSWTPTPDPTPTPTPEPTPTPTPSPTPTPEPTPTPTPNPLPTPDPVPSPGTDTETDGGMDGGNDQNNTGTEEDSENSELNNSGNQNNTGNNVGNNTGSNVGNNVGNNRPTPSYNYASTPYRSYNASQNRLPQTDGASTNVLVWIGLFLLLATTVYSVRRMKKSK